MRRALFVVSVLAFAGVSATGVHSYNATRAAQFSQLPDWSGLWISAVWSMDISGRVIGGDAKLRASLQLLRPPPYNPQWAANYQAALQDKAALDARNAILKVCVRSFPALMEAPWQFQIATLPEETLLVFENGQVRHVYTDGRPHPTGDNLWPTPLGDSIGRWEGQTLVIDTVARSASEPLAPRAWVAMLSEAAHITERLWRVDADTLEDQMRIDDPVSLASPWVLTLQFRHVTEMDRMIPTNCTENDRNPVMDGKMVITQP
jgi:hypothetical protein